MIPALILAAAVLAAVYNELFPCGEYRPELDPDANGPEF